jgi:DNA primase large subunit
MYSVPKIGQATPSSARTHGGAIKADERYGNDNLGLSFYEAPPDVEMSIRAFEEAVLDRLRLLQTFDRLTCYDGRDGMSDKTPQLENELYITGLRLDYPSGPSVDSFPQDRNSFMKRDATSHFALRLAFCKTREAREWLVRQEQRLFVLRFDRLSQKAQDTFLLESGIGCEKFEPAEKDDVTQEYLSKRTAASKVFGDNRQFIKEDTVYYKMPFYEAHPSLIASRKVIIKDGTAYVPSVALKLILAAKFKDSLSTSLEVAQQGLPHALADPRVGGFLKLLQEHGMQLCVATKKQPSSGEELGKKLSLENFEELLVRSFPPCMRRLVEHQREQKKHLKHAGRLQLRPFLKDCGFDYDESMRWWKQELCKDREIDTTTFEKNYTYDVDHAYGKKGHFQGQKSFGCPKIIGFPGEGAGQVHGCPFKQLDMQPLKNMLHKWRIPEKGVSEVEKLIKGGNHHQLACIEYFKAMHPGQEGDGVGNSPNDYFRESCRCYKSKEAGA